MVENFLGAPIEWNPEEPHCNEEYDSTFDVFWQLLTFLLPLWPSSGKVDKQAWVPLPSVPAGDSNQISPHSVHLPLPSPNLKWKPHTGLLLLLSQVIFWPDWKACTALPQKSHYVSSKPLHTLCAYLSPDIWSRLWVGVNSVSTCTQKTWLLKTLFSKPSLMLSGRISHSLPYALTSVYIFSAHYSQIFIITDCACICYYSD